MPAGADTALMQEDVELDGDVVVIPPGVKRGANRRRAGEDVRAGQVALQPGTRLRPQDVGVAATLGRATLEVFRPLEVALLSTGDELREPGAPLERRRDLRCQSHHPVGAAPGPRLPGDGFRHPGRSGGGGDGGAAQRPRPTTTR